MLARLRRQPHCGQPACALRLEQAGTPQRREAREQAAQAEVARRWPGRANAAATVVWIDPHATPRLTRTTRAERAAMQQHLLARAAGQTLAAAVEADPELARDDAADALPDPAPEPRPQADAMCASCGGRCCRIGLAAHAFVDTRLLDRWVERHPGSGRAHAVQAYLDRLPPRHVEGSCLFHTARGCALPREERSAVCNRFECRGLQELKQVLAQQPEASAIALVGFNGRASRGVWIEADGRPHRLRDLG